MPSFLESCKEYFGTDNLYDVLDLKKSASEEDIKKAYRKLSLKVHPDRVEEGEKVIATEKFKILSRIHETLSDNDKRRTYDDTGMVDDDDSLDTDWEQYWRLLFKKITDDDIVNYERNYKGGEEEKTDLIKAYKKFSGDIDMILDTVPFSHPDDIPRFQEILKPLTGNEELPSYEAFFNESKKKQLARKRKYQREAKIVGRIENKKKEEAMDVEESALKAIMQRRKEREVDAESFFARLEAKYANPAKKTKSKKK